MIGLVRPWDGALWRGQSGQAVRAVGRQGGEDCAQAQAQLLNGGEGSGRLVGSCGDQAWV